MLICYIRESRRWPVSYLRDRRQCRPRKETLSILIVLFTSYEPYSYMNKVNILRYIHAVLGDGRSVVEVRETNAILAMVHYLSNQKDTFADLIQLLMVGAHCFFAQTDL